MLHIIRLEGCTVRPDWRVSTVSAVYTFRTCARPPANLYKYRVSRGKPENLDLLLGSA